MTLILFDKKATDCDKRYYAVDDVDYYIHSNSMIEIYYKNGTRESRSTDEIQLVDVAV